jgi:hypothetical protein
LGSDFDGVLIFDEAHAMQNAGGGQGERGDVAASQQGRAGLRLQHALANARVVYVSATGATTVHNLAYAQRLGLWGGEDFPFSTRAEFVEAIEAGGVAAMEVLACDLRALGLYTARSLSFDGVEYELVEHALTFEQTRIYDAYAGAFAIIHTGSAFDDTGVLDAIDRNTSRTGKVVSDTVVTLAVPVLLEPGDGEPCVCVELTLDAAEIFIEFPIYELKRSFHGHRAIVGFEHSLVAREHTHAGSDGRLRHVGRRNARYLKFGNGGRQLAF